MENKNDTNQELIKSIEKDPLTNLDTNHLEETIEKAKPNNAILGGVALTGLSGGGYVLYNNVERTEEANIFENIETILVDNGVIENENIIESPKTNPVIKEAVEKEDIVVSAEEFVDKVQESHKLSDFEQAFAEARANGLSEFSWQNNLYHTKTKEELLEIKVDSSTYFSDVQGSNEILDTEKISMTTEEFENSEINPARIVSLQSEESNENLELELAPNIIRYGALDANNDGRIDNIAIDLNSDGKADGVAIDENSDGIFDVFMLDSDNNGTIDISTRDQNQDGLDVNDTSETVEYEMDMNDYIDIDPNDTNSPDFDILTNLF